MAKVSIDRPLAEITLRKYEKPYDLSGRELVKKFCLSIGLLQPGDSRDIVVDVFRVLLEAKNEKKSLNSKEIEERVIIFRKQDNLPLLGTAASNVRRQLRRLKELFLIENINNNYRISEFEKLSVIFEKKIEKYYMASIVERIKEYFEAIK